MDNMHPLMREALAPFAPPRRSFNDDDVYLIDVRTGNVIKEYGASSETAHMARTYGITVKPGQALVKGMQAKYLEWVR